MVKGNHYINDNELFREIIISKGQGKLTKKAENMLILIANRIIYKLYYKDPMDRQDCLNTAIYQLLKNWKTFNDKKYALCIPFFSEVAKRGLAAGFNEIHPKEDRLAGSMSIDALNSNYF